MRAIAINGSPRRTWNTATLLEKALEGAASAGAETEIVHLYDLDYRGCTSCFSCKRKDGERAGRCAMRDGLTDVLERIMASDVLLLGSPIYLGDVTGEMRSFWERLIFMNLSYDKAHRSNFEGTISTGFIYTMNIAEDILEGSGYRNAIDAHMRPAQILNGESECLIVTDTYQFGDYSKYAASNFDEGHKAKVRAERFPVDCQRAFELGARLAHRR